ncbi:MAG: DUF167 family protein [Candidatus Bathyarchaeota archaeon]|nr:DUF167 family protein [Candidatus Bathyarchaeota archaeon]
MSIKETKDGVILTVFVKPNSPKFQILLDSGELVVYSTEEPQKGKVNKEIIKELTRLFHAQVDLASGATSRQKQFIVHGVAEGQVLQVLEKLA